MKENTYKPERKIDMKFTKVIRSYMEKTLSEKRCAADKADPETQAYLNRKQHAEDEIRAIVDEARYKAREVLDRYGMDIEIRRYGEKEDASKAIIQFYEQYVKNEKEVNAQRERESARYKHQADIMEQIELDCALGADKETFMTMRDKATF